jgi:hypothetical protein
VRVETPFEAGEGVLRAVATGAVALESGAASREPVDEAAQHRAAAAALGMREEELGLVARNDFYRVYCENGAGAVAVVDGLGSVALAEHARRVLAADRRRPAHAVARRGQEVTVNLGVATLLPCVALICGPHVVDLSEARRPEDLLASAGELLDGHEGPAVAVVWT